MSAQFDVLAPSSRETMEKEREREKRRIYPLPVAAKLPNRPILIVLTLSSNPSSIRSLTKILPARMGPTVCDDEGPTPIENRSNVEMTACSARGNAADSSTSPGELARASPRS